MGSNQVDVALVGGGVIGSAAASYLARSGADVLVVDPAPGRGASAGSAGLVVPSYSLAMSNPGVLRNARNDPRPGHRPDRRAASGVRVERRCRHVFPHSVTFFSLRGSRPQPSWTTNHSQGDT
ncbi:FAD-dependent oxidoreductase [Nonomuraea sp. NPDC050540]|uniref:FAD-dependent oxidoreductase n=1 Tax=Nonomuraea sp. NPDC050540 TaxID=3364367 RepID=UPI0037AB368D